MDPATVFYTSWKPFSNMLLSTHKLYEAANLFDVVSRGDLVAIKLHVGELGNPNYIRPFFVKQVVDLVKERGGKPFLTDTSTYYLVARYNAVDHMDTAVANGFGFAPMIIADGLKGENSVAVASPDPILGRVEVAGAIHQADAMIVISHTKGHPLGGYGGAIKNLAMGCVSKQTKLRQHRTVGLELNSELCAGCGACVEACRFKFPRLENDRAVIDDPRCMHCPACSNACPEGAIKLVGKANLGSALAVSAAAVMSCFDRRKVAFVNFAVDISTLCDCLPLPGESLGPDIGVFAGSSPLSTDAATLRRIDYEKLNTLHHTDCWAQIHKLAQLNVPGSIDPKIIEV
ncbi:MAG: DUF362 domain-containing protein [Deltaproteobacteria bacterium]|nr:DUF362 domain-containing protein [Deltaproteobacteria bacterium]